MEPYFGTYLTFHTMSRKEAAELLNADNLIGDRFMLDFAFENNERRIWVVNKFDRRIGYIDGTQARELSLLKAQDMEMVAIMSLVGFSESQDGYYGELAVMAFNPAYAEDFAPFVNKVEQMLKKGTRLDLTLGPDTVRSIIDSNGKNLPGQTVPQPKKKKGEAVIKDHQSLNDRMIEQARAGNKGCYAVSWIFLLAVVAAIIFGLKSCGLF